VCSFAITENGTATILIRGSINLSTGVVSNSIGTFTAENVGNGWWRLVGTTTTTTSTNISLIAYSGNYGGTETGTVFVWGAQLEAGAFPTSYIPTTSAQVTRAADVATMTGTNFSSWYNRSGGTVYVEGETQFRTEDQSFFVGVTDGTASNYFGVYANAITAVNRIDTTSFVGGVSQLSGVRQNNGSYTAGSVVRAALAYAENDAQLATNGSTVGTNVTSCALPTVSSMNVGSGYVAGNRSLNGHIKRIAYFPRRLSNTELQGITA